MTVSVKSSNGSALIGSQRPYQSLTKFSAARKFLAPDSVDNIDERTTGSLSNAEHIIDQASGLSAMSMVVEHLAAAGRASLKSVRDELSGVPISVDADERLTSPHFSDFDVDNMKRQQVSDAVGQLGQIEDHVSVRVTGLTKTLVDQGISSFLPKKQLGESKSVVNTAIPEIESITVKMDKLKGAIDSFFTRVVFNIPRVKIETGEVKLIKFFRSETISPNFTSTVARLSMHGIDRLRSDDVRSRSKNQDYMSMIEHRLNESNLDNSITDLIPFDKFTRQRNSSTNDGGLLNVPALTLTPSDSDTKLSFLNSFLVSPTLAVLDKSVAQNNRALENIMRQNPQLAPGFKLNGLVVGRGSIVGNESRIGDEHFKQLLENDSSHSLVVDKNNSQDFKEIAFVTPEKLTGRTVGDVVEYTLDDDTAVFGRSYRYYLVTIDKNMAESVRSAIVTVDIDGLRIPEVPKRASANVTDRSVSMSILVDDQLVEKFEIYRRENFIGPKRVDTLTVRTVSGKNGFTSENSDVKISDNGFILVGETLNGTRSGGAVFRDKNIEQGKTYTYRIYSVDIFGNKSQSPREIDVYVRDPQKPVDLARPTIVAELDEKTKHARLTVSCDDPGVKKLVLTRRDISLRQKAFVAPSQVSQIKFGNGDQQGSKRFEDVHLQGDDTSIIWNGHIEIVPGEHFVFIDFTSQLDHTYQYQVSGMDRFGNMTDHATSEPLMIVKRQLIKPPVNFSSEISTVNGKPSDVTLTWESGNIDVSSADRVGNRDVLNSSRVRTLYQVERKLKGEDIWKRFPMVEETSLVDNVGDASRRENPEFNLENLKTGETYLYRVQAYQSGSIISNLTLPLEVFVGTPVAIPQNFRVRNCDVKIRPLYAMLNWDTLSGSGPVDKWEIERGVMNNFAADRMNFRNPLDFKKIDYQPYKDVFRESSRFQSNVLDNSGRIRRQNNTIIGQHHFMDTGVEIGNSYFYRIRSVGSDGSRSNWVFKGLKFTDDVVSSKQNLVLSNDDKTRLVSTFGPISFGKNISSNNSNLGSSKMSSYSFGPVAQIERVISLPIKGVV